MTTILEILTGTDPVRRYELVEDEVLVGRDPRCHLLIDDDSVSRTHARFVHQDGSRAIEDLGSRNGTYVNGRRIDGKVPLKEGDRVTIGETEMVLRSPRGVMHEMLQGSGQTTLFSIDVTGSSGAEVRVSDADRLRAITRIGKLLGATLDLRTLLSRILHGLFEIFPQAGRGLVLLREGDRLVPAAVKVRRGGQKSLQYSKTILRKAATQRKAFLSQDVIGDQELQAAPSVKSLQIRSVMCVPLLSRDMKVLGAIELDSHTRRGKFDMEDTEILACVASQASVLVEQARLHREMVKHARVQRDLTLAQEVQRSFLPDSLPQLDGYTFWSHYQAARTVGGDFYDCIPLPNGATGIVLGDVTGKGIPAALMMAKLSALGRQSLLSHPGNVAEMISALNKEVCDIGIGKRFVTLVLCVLDPQSHEMTVGLAGHMPPMIRRADSVVDDSVGYAVRGLPLGMERELEYETEQTRLDPGDLVALFSDGITEAANSKEEFYSVQRVRRQLTHSQAKGPAETGRMLLADVSRHLDGSEQSDDVCVLMFQRDSK